MTQMLPGVTRSLTNFHFYISRKSYDFPIFLRTPRKSRRASIIVILGPKLSLNCFSLWIVLLSHICYSYSQIHLLDMELKSFNCFVVFSFTFFLSLSFCYTHTHIHTQLVCMHHLDKSFLLIESIYIVQSVQLKNLY